MPTLLHPCINYITYGDGDRGIVSCASTISLTGIQRRKTMTNNSNFDDRYYTDNEGVVWYGGC